MSNRVRLFMHMAVLTCGFAGFASAEEVAHTQPQPPTPFTTYSYTTGATAPESPVTPAAPVSPYVNKNYSRLAEILPIYERAAQTPWPIIPETGALHRGVKSDNVVLLRERLQATLDLPVTPENSPRFDKSLVEAVKLFQFRNGLKADGVVGAATRAALNVPADVRARQIRVNMDRWAALSRDLSGRYVLINIPEFQLHLYDNNSEVLTMKVIVGKPSRQTPQLTSRITRIVFNPKWNVPAMIAKNDIIPKAMENPAYLNSEGIRIFNSDQSDSYEINRYDVDWADARENGFPYHFRQDPGAKNALGLVKFEFPNTHDVYMHDTPAKTLFASDVRDFSSGCIRLEKPFALVDYLTQNDERIDSTKIQDTLATRRTTYFSVQKALPVIIGYMTAWVDDQGYTHFAEDIYHLDDPNVPSDIPQDTAAGHSAMDSGDTDDDHAPHERAPYDSDPYQ
jgi:L,D-transpeptidase YcbB